MMERLSGLVCDVSGAVFGGSVQQRQRDASGGVSQARSWFLKQESLRLKGFPLALQLLAYQAVPKLQSTVPIPYDDLSIIDLVEPHLPVYSAPSIHDILRVELDPDLEVTSLIPIHSQPQPGWGVWPDVSNDDRVAYMEKLIADHRPFKKHLWHGGDTSEPIFTPEEEEDEPILKEKPRKSKVPRKKATKLRPPPKEALKPRKTSKKAVTAPCGRTQRRCANFLNARSLQNATSELSSTLSGDSQRKYTKFTEDVRLNQLRTYLTTRSPKRLWRKPPSSANTRHSFTAQHLSANQQMVKLHSSLQNLYTLHLSKPHLYTIHQYTTALNKLYPSIHLPSTPLLSTFPSKTTRLPIQPPSFLLQLLPLPYVLLPPSTILVHTLTPHLLLADGKAIFKPLSPDPPSLTQPRYDSSNNPASRRKIFALSPLPSTPETSPNKSSNSLPDDIVELSDGSPARERQGHMPCLEEGYLAKELFRCKDFPALDLISPLPQVQWDIFNKIITKFKAAFHITPSEFEFSNNLLLELAEPQHWTTTYMEILMHMLAARHSRLLEEQKLAFVSPLLTSGIQEISKRFLRSTKKESFTWDKHLTDIVLQSGKKWMEDVFTVYTPMLWAKKHWVGLAINLDLGCVEILDPLPSLCSDKTVARHMAPVLKALPFLVKKVANYQLTQFCGLEAFTWHRIPNLYINKKGGDCGPESVKFFEIHAHGDPAHHMSNITDRQVDAIRKQYALDIYKTIVMPAYYKPPKA
ncbi:hypothetical protein Bca101_057997 [Brassica carinata]